MHQARNAISAKIRSVSDEHQQLWPVESQARRPVTDAESAEASAELAARVAVWENEGGAAG